MYYMADLFRMLCTKFYQNRVHFTEDMAQKTFWLTFFLDTVYSLVPKQVYDEPATYILAVHLATVLVA